ncbi:serine hydrolase [Ruminococcus sp. Marseille-P6503]|uniref:serine hydrolase n=1 Tax=Ruminococcus sp. Marseille-P6503 TaxID=2364796 RepID=UPI000F52E660|nr:serine hydrolase [Ruminococcus sp. Marseille-P6503]
MKKLALLAASVFALSVFSGCDNKESPSGKTEFSSYMKTVTSETSNSNADSSNDSRTETKTDSSSKAYSSSQAESSKPAAAAVQNAEPENVSEDTLNSHRVSLSGFSKVISNKELENCLDRIDEICGRFGTTLAFSYENIETGAQINYNSDKQFMTCSTIKAPYVKSILASGIDLDTRIVKNKNWIGDVVGEDYIASMDMGTVFTAKELIEAAIQRSDNTAYYLLEQHYGWNVFNSLQYEIGADYYVGSDWIFTYASTSDMLKSYRDIYRFGEENELGEWLTDLMTDTDLNEQIGKKLSEKYKVAQKYGSEFNESVYNDCAIVYAGSPFVLCIFTQQYPETEQSNQVFTDLADIFDEINSLIYS